MGVKRLSSSIALILWIFLDIDKFSDLNLSKFQLFDLNKILTILFSLFLIILYLLLPNSSFLIISTNTKKWFTDFVKINLNIKLGDLAILLKLWMKY